MKRILILKDVLYATNGSAAITSINNVNTLAAGALAIFAEDGNLVDPAGIATDMLDRKRVCFAVGGVDAAGNKIARVSPYYDRFGNINVIKKAYVAPVKHVVQIGNDGSAGAINAPTLTGSPQVAGIKVIDTSGGTQPPLQTKTYEEPVRAGDTALTVMLRMITRINADTDAFVVATDPSGTGAGVVLTATNYGVYLAIATYGIFEDADVYVDGTNSSTPITYGTGTPAMIESIWQELSAVMGNTNKVELQSYFFTATSGVDTAVTYDMYWIQSEVLHQLSSGNSQIASTPELIIAMPAGAGTLTQANFDIMMAEIFGANRIKYEVGT